MRFNGQEIREKMADYCLPEIVRMINRLGGLDDEGLVSRRFHNLPGGMGQRLTLMEGDSEYDEDSSPER